MYNRALPSILSPGLTKDFASFILSLIAAVIPFLMHFIVNFTITNLHYMEDMGNLSSEIFNATERHLQQLVRAPYHFSLFPHYATACCLSPSCSRPFHSFPAGALVQEQQHWFPLCWLQTGLAQVRTPLKHLQKPYFSPFMPPQPWSTTATCVFTERQYNIVDLKCLSLNLSSSIC